MRAKAVEEALGELRSWLEAEEAKPAEEQNKSAIMRAREVLEDAG